MLYSVVFSFDVFWSSGKRAAGDLGFAQAPRDDKLSGKRNLYAEPESFHKMKIKNDAA
jgi:hypothetical protein